MAQPLLGYDCLRHLPKSVPKVDMGGIRNLVARVATFTQDGGPALTEN